MHLRKGGLGSQARPAHFSTRMRNRAYTFGAVPQEAKKEDDGTPDDDDAPGIDDQAVFN